MKTRLIGAILAIVLAFTGTLVLTGYVRGADARASDGAKLLSVYVVAEKIPAGTSAVDAAESISTKRVPALAAVPGRVTNLADLEGKVADVALAPGEQLLQSRWVEPERRSTGGEVALPEEMQAVTLALPLEHVVGGTLEAGDSVGIVISATMKPAGGQEVAMTRQIFHKVLVTAVQQGTTTRPADEEDAANGPVDALMVTLARPTPDIEKLVWGQEFGSVWLTIEPEEADESGSRAVDARVVFE